jgi:hypothetical protein
MPSAGPTDDFWLAAHDGVMNARVIGDRPFGIGLAAGLLVELVHGDWCQLWDGELFRTTTPDRPRDAVLGALLDKMEHDERQWPPSAPVPPTPRSYVGAHVQPPHGQVWPPVPRPARPAGRGHRVRDWMAYLANQKRAETLVGDRLTRSGRAWREEHGRVLKRVRYMPRDTLVTGTPASRIQAAAQHGTRLSWSDLVLVGLCLATGLHQHALSALTPAERHRLLGLLDDLDEQSWELIKATNGAVGDAAAVR